eukprot:881770-Amphidinium_carterae.1
MQARLRSGLKVLSKDWAVRIGSPKWAENLNSVLDDNKLLTLPNGLGIVATGMMSLLMKPDSDLPRLSKSRTTQCTGIESPIDTPTDLKCHHSWP